MSKTRYRIAARALEHFDYSYSHGFVDDELSPLDFIVEANFGGNTLDLVPVIRKAVEVMGVNITNPDLSHFEARSKLLNLKRACR
jgi:hypothetical protein